jgi:single-strand DNA-binding protein
MNKIVLMGRLTADPELKYTQSNTAVIRFTVAVNRKFADKQTGKREADFISCTAWSQTAEFISKYFKKGQMICVEGELRSNSYQDKNHPDVTHYTTDVFVNNVEFTGSKAESGSTGNGYNNNNNGYTAPQNNYNSAAESIVQKANSNYIDVSQYDSLYGDEPF